MAFEVLLTIRSNEIAATKAAIIRSATSTVINTVFNP